MRSGGWILVALAALLLSPSLQAQWAPDAGGYSGGDMHGSGGMSGGMGGGPGGHGGGMHGRPPGHRMDFPSPDELEGPLSPAAMSSIADLDSAGSARYAERYTPHMAATKPVRDSLRVILRTLREDRESGDPEAMRAEMQQQGPAISRLWKDLSKRDEQFYQDATQTFTKDERKKFKKWQDDDKKAHEAERPHGPGGGGESGWNQE